jgi:putative flippase GtrA
MAARPPGTKGILHWLVDAHWLGSWRTPLVLRLWRYGAGSVFAFAVSSVVVTVCYSWLGLGAITSSTIAFLAGAVPNWVLNRRWAWGKRGRDGVGRESTLYALITLVSWGAYTGVTKLAALAVAEASTATRDIVVTMTYMGANVLFSALKYVAYDRVVFAGRNDPEPRASRSQVPTTTFPNRQP